MNRNSTRLTVVAGTTMALVVAATAAVSAAGPRDRGWDDDFGLRGRMAERMGPGGPGFGFGLRGMDEDFERREVTLQTVDGTTSSRVEQGTLDSADEASVSFLLASGEAVTVTLDDDTQVVGFQEQEVTRGGWSRTRLAPTAIAAADIEAGSQVIVWSDAEDGADFVASRVVVTPAEDEAADATTEADDIADEAEAADETVTDDAAATDA
jgi:hypothetical protein